MVVRLDSVAVDVEIDDDSVVLDGGSRLLEVDSAKGSEDVEIGAGQGGPAIATTEISSTLYCTGPDPSLCDILIPIVWRSPLTLSWDLTSKYGSA